MPPPSMNQPHDSGTPPAPITRGAWALVTGASAGIGEEFARALARRGMNLVLTARREDRLRALTAELAARHGVQAVAVRADLAEAGAPLRLWREATAGREIHLVVNNAGFGLKGRFDELPLGRQSEMVQLNCTALLELAHLAVADMRPRGRGGILNVASIAAYQPIPFLATYAASKAFVLSLSEALAEEVREDGIRVVALCPGAVETEFQGVAGTTVSEKTLGIRTAEQVVAAGLAALEGNRTTVVPGLANRVSTAVTRVAPRSWVVRGAKAVMQRLR